MTPTLGTTQERHPWRATIRTAFQALVALALMAPGLINAAGIDETVPWVAGTLAVTGAITRIMALPAVESFLRRFVPFLAADRDG